ncbi:MAG: glycosyltransferase 61 family protein, partial [Hyphococcus sp.]
KDGRLIERFSSCKPGLRMLAEPWRPAAERPEGYFIQSEHTDTFGDWMAEYLSPLSHLPAIDAPVYLPRAFADKPYVQRDAARTGINFVIVDEPICIRRARVVRQQRVIRYWRPEDVEALRRLLKAEPAPARPGSILYLSRHGEASDVADRSHPNLLIESVVKACRGRTIRSGEATLEDYLAAGADADTVLYDHGSAAYNMVYWRPRRIIEFVSDAWWMNSFLLFAYAAGVRDYTTVLTDRRSDADLRLLLEKTLNAPIDDTASSDA